MIVGIAGGDITKFDVKQNNVFLVSEPNGYIDGAIISYDELRRALEKIVFDIKCAINNAYGTNTILDQAIYLVEMRYKCSKLLSKITSNSGNFYPYKFIK